MSEEGPPLAWSDCEVHAGDLEEHKIVARPGRCAGVVLYVRRRTDGAGRRVQFEVDKGTAEAMIRELRDAVEG